MCAPYRFPFILLAACFLNIRRSFSVRTVARLILKVDAGSKWGRDLGLSGIPCARPNRPHSFRRRQNPDEPDFARLALKTGSAVTRKRHTGKDFFEPHAPVSGCSPVDIETHSRSLRVSATSSIQVPIVSLLIPNVKSRKGFAPMRKRHARDRYPRPFPRAI